jgi:hypothetical protein
LRGCKKGWNPDEQEQRYCYACRHWFHIECLPTSKEKTQAFVVDVMRDGESGVPTILWEMAYQPAARGGERHFTAGNIRLTTKARGLLSSEKARQDFTGNERWHDDKWKKALRKHFKMKKSDEGRVDREQLVLYGQAMYSCGLCGTLI